MDLNIERLGHSVTSNSVAKLSAALIASLAVAPYAQAAEVIEQPLAQHLQAKCYYAGTSSSQTGTTVGWELRKVGVEGAIAEIAQNLLSRQTRLGDEIEAVLSAHRSELYA